jgi:predicted RNase H-like nuclease
MLVGVDGCAEGWICVIDDGTRIEAIVAPTLPHLLERLAPDAIVAIDVPIGLPEFEPRACDRHAPRLLGRPRGSSVFPAPVRASLAATAMRHRKSGGEGRRERQALIDAERPGLRTVLRERLRGRRCKPDDLNDALAALWTARRIRDREAVVLPGRPKVDSRGLRMEIVA